MAAPTRPTAPAYAELLVGERVRIDDPEKGETAVIRYIGPILTYKDPKLIWVGVEWDRDGRGKHDGLYEGTRYFWCRPGAGSFIRAERLNTCGAGRRHGKTVLEAIKERYAAEHKEEELYVVSKEATATRREVLKKVEFVGAEKAVQRLSQLHLLKMATLVDAQVSRVGPPGELKSAVPGLSSLDLEGNLLWSWRQVARICEELSCLEEIRLSRNLLHSFEEAEKTPSLGPPPKYLASYPPPGACRSIPDVAYLREAYGKAFGNLRVLVLNDVPRAWEQVCVLDAAGCLPRLEELHVCHNDMSTFDCSLPLAPAAANGTTTMEQQQQQQQQRGSTDAAVLPKVTGFRTLRVLNLSYNAFDDWRQIVRLSALPKLESLILTGNRIAAVPLSAMPWPRPPDPEDEEGAAAEAEEGKKGGEAKVDPAAFEHFPCLHTLSLNENQIADVASIEALHWLPRLARLRFQGNPIEKVLELPLGGMRHLLIATLPRLRNVNLSDVRPRERLDAEKFYLRFFYERCSAAANAVAASSGASKLTAPVVPSTSLPGLPARYAALVAIHGDPAVTSGAAGAAAGSGTAVANRLLTLHFVDREGKEVAQRRLPPSMRVVEVKKLLLMACKLPANSAARIGYRDSEGDAVEELSDQMKPLAYYSVASGGQIVLLD